MDVRLHEAGLADLDALLPLVAAYRIFYEQTPDAACERAFLEDNLAQRRSAIVLARDEDDAAVGFAQMLQTYSTVWLGRALILEDLYVEPRARRCGVASALLQWAIAFAAQIGAVGMFLETAMDNTPAQAAYERAGWTREERFYKYNAPR